MNTIFSKLLPLFISLALFGCATTLPSLPYAHSTLSPGDEFAIPSPSVLYMHRGYIDSIQTSSKPMNRLRSPFDYEDYHTKPKADIPPGTTVKILKIRKTKAGDIFVTALFEGEKVNISQIIRQGMSLENK